MRAEELERRLAAWRVPGPTPEETEALVARVLALPRPGAFRRVLERERGGAVPFGGTLRAVLQVTLAQAGFFRPWCWLASAVTVAGGLVFLRLSGSSATVLLGALVPAITALGVAYAFRAADSGAWEIELACPISPTQLALGRLVVVVAYDIALGLAASLVVWWGTPPLLLSALILSWLVPLLLTASFTLYLCLCLPVGGVAAGVLAASFWVIQVAVRRAGLAVSLFVLPGDAGRLPLHALALAAAVLFGLAALRAAGMATLRPAGDGR